MSACRTLLLSGTPGIGKTTIISRVVEAAKKRKIAVIGFYTEEVRGEDGRRVGFDLVRTDGSGRRALARRGEGAFRVGPYAVDVDAVRDVGLKVLAEAKGAKNVLLCIDELGKMEFLCADFLNAVNEALDYGLVTICTMPSAPLPQLPKILQRPDVREERVTKENRDALAYVLSMAIPKAVASCRPIELEEAPMGATGLGLRSLLLGEFASPLASEYAERSCWLVLDKEFGIDRPISEQRQQALSAHGIAVWDVRARTHTKRKKPPPRHPHQVRDFDALVQEAPNLERIAFNGNAAAAAFTSRYTSQISIWKGEDFGDYSVVRLADKDIRLFTLPSSSNPSNFPSLAVEDCSIYSLWRQALFVNMDDENPRVH